MFDNSLAALLVSVGPLIKGETQSEDLRLITYKKYSAEGYHASRFTAYLKGDLARNAVLRLGEVMVLGIKYDKEGRKIITLKN